MAAKNSIGQTVRKRAMSYPQVTEEFPWGESAFKVKGKTFIFMREEKDAVSFSVKLPQSRDFALSLPGSEPTHYGMGAKGWVTLNPKRKIPADVLYSLIDESYRAVAPKMVLKELDKANSR